MCAAAAAVTAGWITPHRPWRSAFIPAAVQTTQLRERVKLVQELDQLADAMVAEALELARTCTVETEEYFVPKTRKVLVPSA